MSNQWISVSPDTMPEKLVRVYVIVESRGYLNKIIRNQTIAQYVPKLTVLESDFMDEDYYGDGDYSEEKDEYYTPEGFYESCIEPEINYKIGAKVTHWMPLITLPPQTTNT